MMVRCVAPNCSNATAPGRGMFTFPDDPELNKLWRINMGKAKRAGTLFELWENTKYSRLCDQHFENHCFGVSPRFAESIGFKPGRLQLKPDAVPTIFHRACKSNTTRSPRGAFEKRKRREVGMGDLKISDPEKEAEENHTSIGGLQPCGKRQSGDTDELQKLGIVKENGSGDSGKSGMDNTGDQILEKIDCTTDEQMEASEGKGLQNVTDPIISSQSSCIESNTSSVALYDEDSKSRYILKDKQELEENTDSGELPNTSEDLPLQSFENIKIQTITINEDDDLFDFQKISQTSEMKESHENPDIERSMYNIGDNVDTDKLIDESTGEEILEPQKLQKMELYKYLMASNVDDVKSSEVTPLHSDHDSNEESGSDSETSVSGSYTSASSEDDQPDEINDDVENMQDSEGKEENHSQPETEEIPVLNNVVEKPKPTPAVRKSFRPRLTKKMRNILAKTSERIKKSKEVTDRWLKELELPKNLDLSNPVKLNINDLNKYLTCGLCSGYLYEASTITECMHTFCKTCIVRHCMEVSLNCPVCNILIHPTDPFVNIRLDRMIQDIVYKLLPDVADSEMKNIREFYAAHPDAEARELNNCPSRPKVSPAKSEVSTESSPFVSLVLESESDSLSQKDSLEKKFVRVKGTATIGNLSNFLRTKLNLEESQGVDIFCHGDLIEESNSTLQAVRERFFNNEEDCLMLLQYRVCDP